MKILELFAGSRSIGNIADRLGHDVFSIDINDFEGINLAKDIEFVTCSDIPFVPDMIWASPPCTTYSIAAISHHRNGHIAISEFAKKSDRLVLNTLNLVSKFKKENSDLIYYIENPRGMMRKMPFMKHIPKTTVTYCSYGDTRMKPTDIWSNNLISLFNTDGWQPKKMCFNGNTDCHHEAAPRGSRTGTQGLSSAYVRSKIPKELCEEIINATNKRISNV